MARGDFANPFTPQGWTGSVEWDVIYSDTPLVNTGTLIAPPDPQRLYLVVMGYGSIGDWGVWPRKLPSVGGIKQQTGTGHVLIHNASYPSLVQSEWWLAMGAASGPVEVISARSI